MPEGVNLDDRELVQGRGHRQLDDASESACDTELFEKQPTRLEARREGLGPRRARRWPSCSSASS